MTPNVKLLVQSGLAAVRGQLFLQLRDFSTGLIVGIQPAYRGAAYALLLFSSLAAFGKKDFVISHP